ncbi:phosphotransferase [Paenibacillus gorillae]|uniref:phosphotransferase n=1 Tax=Paenibacillus gorillae TaxID=1243662 RepID=UPI0004AEDC56|nr:phosphotransferase [Paenibacillus gorillae]
MSTQTNEIFELIQAAVKKFISASAAVVEIESAPLHLGFQAVDLSRHQVVLEDEGTRRSVSLITKMASRTERLILHRLFSQSANVPFSHTNDMDSEHRALLCIQNVDEHTDYQNLNIDLLQKKEAAALAYIHQSNLGCKEQLLWLPAATRDHAEQMLNTRWRPSWEKAIQTESFIEAFGAYIPEVEAAAACITADLEVVLNDESSHTLIHNDLNPGNVLVHNNDDVYFIDWEEARYGSLYLDVPLRLDIVQARDYLDELSSHGVVLPSAKFESQYKIAARYLGLRFMAWNLGAWAHDLRAKEGLIKYLKMATS